MSKETQARSYVAIDLGAESGRAVLGRLQSGRLSIEEIRRFPNEPVKSGGGLHWDVPRLWLEIRAALNSVATHGVERLDGIGVDTWGIDYALLGEKGALLENPYHYRDSRTDGLMARALKILTPEMVYRTTGIQFLPFNTLYQLYAASLQTPNALDLARHFVTIPDLFNFWMTGRITCEYTNASTTQCLDIHTRQWSLEILDGLGIPTRIVGPLIEPGSIVGKLLPDIAAQSALSGTPVIAPACHDTGSAFAAVQTGGRVALISSGTWSLLGMELPTPVVTNEARRLNFTNEAGVCGTTRLLKNITGMWLLERCRRSWQGRGAEYSYPELLAMASPEKPLQRLVDPDDTALVSSPDMPEAIAAFCAKTSQPKPASPGATTRAVLESLAMKYRFVLESLERLTGTKVEEIRVVGGGSQNDLLNQFTADATRCRVLAGPVEATSLGNLAMQMVATRAVNSLSDARIIIAECFPVRSFEPQETDLWETAYQRFRAILATDNERNFTAD